MSLPLILTFALSIAGSPGTKPPRALLIGVGEYPHLGKSLEGPPNDVALMRRTLIGSLGFDKEEIRTLVTGGESDRLPTRERILAGLDELARDDHTGELVIVFLAGHGSRVPDTGELDEVDNMDEVFLPCDTRSWEQDSVPGAITDDVLGEKLRAISATGARLWLIADCCFSGTIHRGARADAVRRLDAQQLGIPDHLRKSMRRGLHEEVPNVADSEIDDDLVVFTAARQGERAPERLRPRIYSDGPSRKQGLLTYNLVRELIRTGAGTTFADLIRRVEMAYVTECDYTPRPTALGDLQREIVSGARRSADWAAYREDNQFFVTAGWLHGISAGAVFRVRMEDRDFELRVTGLEPNLSRCELVGDAPNPRSIPARSHLPAHLVSSPVAPARLRIATGGSRSGALPDAAVQSLLDGLTWVDLVEDEAEAEWILEGGSPMRLAQRGGLGRAYWVREGRLEVDLARVRRATQLVRLADDPMARGLPEGLTVDLRLRRGDSNRPVDTLRGVAPGAVAGLRVDNSTDEEWAVWIFSISRDCEISLLEGRAEARSIAPRSSAWLTEPLWFQDTTLGPEVLLVVATRSQTADLAGLMQPPLHPFRGYPYRARDRAASELRSGPESAPQQGVVSGGSPLGGLFRSILDPKRSAPTAYTDHVRAHVALIPFEVRWPVPELDSPLSDATLDLANEKAGRQLLDALATLPIAIDVGPRGAWNEENRSLLIGGESVSAIAIDLPDRGWVEGADSFEGFRPVLVIGKSDGAFVVAYDLVRDGPLAFERILIDRDHDMLADEEYYHDGKQWVHELETRRDVLCVSDLGLTDNYPLAIGRVANAIEASADPTSGFVEAELSATPAPVPFSKGDLRRLVGELIESDRFELPEEFQTTLLVDLTEEDQVNARSGPVMIEGEVHPCIVADRGLVEHLGDDRLIRAVLAHELAHLVCGHGFQRESMNDLRHHLTRVQEHQADVVGAELLVAAGYDAEDMVDALLAFDELMDSNKVRWFDRIAGDHASPRWRIAKLDNERDARDAIARFEHGLAYLECRSYQAAMRTFESVLEDLPDLSEARYNLARAALMDYYAQLSTDVRGDWLRPAFGAMMTRSERFDARGGSLTDQDITRWERVDKLIGSLPAHFAPVMYGLLRGTTDVMHPRGGVERIERGIGTLRDAIASAEDSSLVPDLGCNIAVGLHRLGREESAFDQLVETLMLDPRIYSDALAEDSARLVPEGVTGPRREALERAFVALAARAPVSDTAHAFVRRGLERLGGKGAWIPQDEVPSATLRLCRAVTLVVDDRELDIYSPLESGHDGPLGKPLSHDVIYADYELERFAWGDSDGEIDIVALTEATLLVRVTSHRTGSFVRFRSETDPGAEYRITVGMTQEDLGAFLGKIIEPQSRYMYANLLGKDDHTAKPWIFFPFLNCGIRVQGGVVTAISVTPIAQR